MRRRMTALAAMLALVVASLAASPAAAQTTDEDQYGGEGQTGTIQGVVTEVGGGSVTVEGTSSADACGAAILELSEGAEILLQQGEQTAPGTAEDLRVGTSVEATYAVPDGPRTMECPQTYEAMQVVVFDEEEDPQTATFRGTITEISGHEVLVEENPDDPASGEKGRLTAGEDTEILRQSGGELVAADIDELRVGQFVEATYSSPVAQSYPFLAGAERIVILEGDSGTEPPKDPGNGDDQYPDPGNGEDQYSDPGNGDDQYPDPGNGGDWYGDSPSGPPSGGDAGSGSGDGDSTGSVEVLPDTGGAALLTLGVGGLLIAGGLLARRLIS